MYIEAHSQYPKGRSNMSIHKWINKIWYIHTEENYSSIHVFLEHLTRQIAISR